MSVKWLLAGVVAFSAIACTSAAFATSGPGCFQVVNVQNWDVLNIRALPSARERIIGRIPPEGHGIVAQEGRCLPLDRPMPQRWCQIGYYDGDLTVYGFVKRRFLRPGECP